MARDWLVVADDRTGALETAAEIARHAGPVAVTVGVAPASSGVVDIGTRAMTVVDAVAAMRQVPSASWQAHKMDSTLRGNWAAELRTRGERTVVLAAWPLMGRTCRRGVVHVHDEPVAAVRDHLPESALLADLDALGVWLKGDGVVAALDIVSTAEMEAAAVALAGAPVLIAGPAGPIGACFGAAFGGNAPASSPLTSPALDGPVLVVCGSATEVSREQLRRLRSARPDIEVLAAPPAEGALTPEVARALAAAVVGREPRTTVVVGGDTAAAVLGDAPRLVGGIVASGMPWSLDEHGAGPVVITKAGGFGDPDALVRLFNRETG